MKKLLLKILLFICIVSVLVFALPILCIAPRYLGLYNASLTQKIDRLYSINEPKIILIGNSNLAFGMDSALLEELTGMPVVNTGFHAGLGNAFHERIARVNTNAGDIVIICHTTYADDGTILDPNLVWITIENHFRLWKLVPVQSIPQVIAAYPRYLRNMLFSLSDDTANRPNITEYSISAFNEYGDNTYMRKYNGIRGEDILPEVNAECTSRLNRLNRYVAKRGASLLISCSPLFWNGRPNTATAAASLTLALQKNLDCAVISDFSDYLYPPELFFGTQYHLTNEGAEIRTRQLASDIAKWRAGQSAPAE